MSLVVTCAAGALALAALPTIAPTIARAESADEAAVRQGHR